MFYSLYNSSDLTEVKEKTGKFYKADIKELLGVLLQMFDVFQLKLQGMNPIHSDYYNSFY